MPARKKEQTVVHLLRDERGLLKNKEYTYDKYGFVKWRDLIDKEFIYLNKFNLALKGIDVEVLSDEEKENIISSANEEDLVIGLEGFRDLARVRGIKSIKSRLDYRDPSLASVTVSIEWIPNFEYPEGLTGEATAGANLSNTEGVFANYLETIAENRAFCRAVRHSLGIASPAKEEIKWDESYEIKKKAPSLSHALNDLLEENKIPFEIFKARIIEEEMEWKDEWKSLSDIDNGYIVKFYNFTLDRIKKLKK